MWVGVIALLLNSFTRMVNSWLATGKCSRAAFEEGSAAPAKCTQWRVLTESSSATNCFYSAAARFAKGRRASI